MLVWRSGSLKMLAFLGHSGRRTGLKSPVRNLKLNIQKCKNNHMLVWRNGRRTGLKILRGQLRVGSSPTTSTTKIVALKAHFLFESSRGQAQFLFMRPNASRQATWPQLPSEAGFASERMII